MKYKVKVGDHQFDVELNNIHSQPIIALVDGEAVEVWLEDPALLRISYKPSGGQGLSIGTNALHSPAAARPKPEKIGDEKEGIQKAVRFPIPGVIVSLSVKEGDEVEVGQELCVLEAMKMKNVIRAPYAGSVASVRVITGQTVKHHDILMEYVG